MARDGSQGVRVWNSCPPAWEPPSRSFAPEGPRNACGRAAEQARIGNPSCRRRVDRRCGGSQAEFDWTGRLRERTPGETSGEDSGRDFGRGLRETPREKTPVETSGDAPGDRMFDRFRRVTIAVAWVALTLPVASA